MITANGVVARLAGAVLLIAGLGLLALFALLVERQYPFRVAIPVVVLILGGAIGTVGLICSSIGFRLAFNRPNRYQSLLPPLGWYALAIVFAALGATLSMLIVRGGHYEQLIGAVCTVLFAWWCWKAGKVAQARGRTDASII